MSKPEQVSYRKEWRDRNDKTGPTKERQAKSTFVEVDAEDAGESYAQEEHAGPLGALFAQDMISARQYEAGRQAEAVLRRGMGSPSTKSCLDFDPVGHEPEDDTDGEVFAMAEYRDFRAHFRAHPSLWSELLRVTWEGEKARYVFTLESALDRAADFFRIEVASK